MSKHFEKIENFNIARECTQNMGENILFDVTRHGTERAGRGSNTIFVSFRHFGPTRDGRMLILWLSGVEGSSPSE